MAKRQTPYLGLRNQPSFFGSELGEASHFRHLSGQVDMN
jgi:hypothetical protein